MSHDYLVSDESHSSFQATRTVEHSCLYLRRLYKQKEAMLDKQVIHSGSSSELYLIGTQFNFQILFSWSLMVYITSLSM